MIPRKLLDTPKALCYFAEDVQYKTPEASLLFRIKTPAFDGSARSYALTSLLCKEFYDKFSSTLFLAGNAGLGGSFTPGDLCLSIKVSGYSEKAPALTETIFNSLKTLSCTEEDFDLYKTTLLSVYANSAFDLPVKQAMNTMKGILESTFPTPVEQHKH